MSFQRYKKTPIIANNSPKYDEIFQEKNVSKINHLTTNSFKDITNDIIFFEYTYHTWSAKDKLTTLAYRYYNDTRLWFVIALANKVPNEFSLNVGDNLLIPFPIEKVLTYYGLI
jgi:nucleoid-associated protein YgaU